MSSPSRAFFFSFLFSSPLAEKSRSRSRDGNDARTEASGTEAQLREESAMRPLALLLLPPGRDLSAEKHSGAPRDNAEWTLRELLYTRGPPRTCVLRARVSAQRRRRGRREARARARTSLPEGSTRSRNSASRPPASPLVSSSPRLARTSSSRALLDSTRRQRPARLASRRRRPLLLLLLLAPSPDDSALAARAHICTRGFASLSLRCCSLSYLSLSLSRPDLSRRTRQTRSVSLSRR